MLDIIFYPIDALVYSVDLSGPIENLAFPPAQKESDPRPSDYECYMLGVYYKKIYLW